MTHTERGRDGRTTDKQILPGATAGAERDILVLFRPAAARGDEHFPGRGGVVTPIQRVARKALIAFLCAMAGSLIGMG